MDLGLKGKNAIVTGGSQGVGFAIAQGLAREDCNVALAVSLHSANNSVRENIVPINKIHPIEKIGKELRDMMPWLESTT